MNLLRQYGTHHGHHIGKNSNNQRMAELTTVFALSRVALQAGRLTHATQAFVK